VDPEHLYGIQGRAPKVQCKWVGCGEGCLFPGRWSGERLCPFPGNFWNFCSSRNDLILVDSEVLHYVSKARQIWQAVFSTIFFIIFAEQHQPTFRDDMHIQYSLSLHFYSLHFLLNICDGHHAKHNVFSLLYCWWLWKEQVSNTHQHAVAVVQPGMHQGNYQLLECGGKYRCSKWCPFAFTHVFSHFLHWQTAS